MRSEHIKHVTIQDATGVLADVVVRPAGRDAGQVAHPVAQLGNVVAIAKAATPRTAHMRLLAIRRARVGARGGGSVQHAQVMPGVVRGRAGRAPSSRCSRTADRARG